MRGKSAVGQASPGAIVAALVLALVGVTPAQARVHQKPPRLSISVLSGRADLVSGGSALVAINLPRARCPARQGDARPQRR